MILLSADGGSALSRSNGSRFKSFRTSRNRSDNSTTLSTTTTTSSRLGGGHRRSFERLRDDHQHQHYLQPKPQPQEQTKKPMTSASSSNTKSGQEEQKQEEVDLVFSSSDSCSSSSASWSNKSNQAKSAALWMPSAFRRVSSTLVSPTAKRSSSMPAKPTMRRTTSTVKPPHVRSSTSTVTAKTESIISLSSGPTNSTKNKNCSKSRSSTATVKASVTNKPLASPSKLPSKKESAEKKKKKILEDNTKTKRQKKKEEKMDKKKQKQNQRTKLQHLSKSKDMDAAEQELMGILEKFQQEQRQASSDTRMTKKDVGQDQRGPDETRDDNDEFADLGRSDEEDDILVITRRQKQQLRSVSPPTTLPTSDSRPPTRPRSFWRRAGWSFGSNASTVVSSASTSKQNNSSGVYAYQLANHDDEDKDDNNNNNTGWRYGRAPSHQLHSTNRYINMKNNEDDEASSGILVQNTNSKSKKTSNNVANKDKTSKGATAKKLQSRSMQEQKNNLFPSQIYIDRSSSYRSGRRSQDNDDSTLSTGDTLTNDETDTSTLTSSFGRASSGSVTMTTMEHHMQKLGLEQASRAILLEPPSWKWFDAFVEVACQVGDNNKKQGTKKLTNNVVDEACQEEHTIEFFATETKDKEEEVEKSNDDDADDGLPSMPSSVSSFDSQIGCFQ